MNKIQNNRALYLFLKEANLTGLMVNKEPDMRDIQCLWETCISQVNIEMPGDSYEMKLANLYEQRAERGKKDEPRDPLPNGGYEYTAARHPIRWTNEQWLKQEIEALNSPILSLAKYAKEDIVLIQNGVDNGSRPHKHIIDLPFCDRIKVKVTSCNVNRKGERYYYVNYNDTANFPIDEDCIIEKII